MVTGNVEHLNEIGVELIQEAGLGPEMTTMSQEGGVNYQVLW